MRPVQLGTQCVPFWIGFIKLSAEFQLSLPKPTAIFGFYGLSQVLDEIRSLIGTFFSLLLLLEYPLADIPIHEHAGLVDAADSMTTGLVDDFPYLINKLLDIAVYN